MEADISSDPDASAPLAGVRVLELGGRPGAYCGKLLADLGADVVLVEHPGGHDHRRSWPFRRGLDGRDESLVFSYYHRNKRAVTLDFGSFKAEPLLEELGQRADVIVISPEGRRPVFGLSDPGTHLSWAGPSPCVCSITPYGRTGPWRNWRATPFTSFAATGQMHPVGPPAGPPLSMPGQQLYDKACIRASALIQALLFRSDEQVRQHIDISANEVGTWEKLLHERFAQSARITTRETNFGPPPGGVWKCADGYVDIAAHAPRHWNIFLEVIGQPDDLMEPLFEDRAMRVQLFDLLTDLISAHLSTMSAPDIVDRGQAMGLPCALKYTPGEFLQDKQPAIREFWAQAEVPGVGPVNLPGRPYRSTPDIFSYRRGVPARGEHNTEIYQQELGHSEDQLQKWAEDGVV